MNSEYLGDGMVRLGTGEIVPALRQHRDAFDGRVTMRIGDPLTAKLEALRVLSDTRIDDLERHRRILAWLLVLALVALAGCVSGILS